MSSLQKANTEKQKRRGDFPPRLGWKQLIQEALQAHGEKTADTEWLAAPLTDDSDWEWQNEAA